MEKNIIEALLRFSNKIDLLSKQARDFETGDLLYATEIHTIVTIGKNPGINLTQLSSKMGVSKSAASKFVKKILKKGYLIKSKSIQNQKEVIFNITEKGTIAFKSHEKYSQIKFHELQQMLKDMPEEHKTIISNFLNKINEGIISL